MDIAEALYHEAAAKLAEVQRRYDAACRRYRAGEPGADADCQRLFNELRAAQAECYRARWAAKATSERAAR